MLLSKPTLLAAAISLLGTFSAFAQVGGGYAGNGLSGEYFANPDLTGSPAFTRRELRLDFDWGTVLPIGGSNDPRYQAVQNDNFSARFTGKVIPAFSETYTFKLVANDGARLFIRPEGGASWTPLIDQWTTAGTYTATSAFVKGTRYEIKVEYRELTGAAALRLLWSSPSTDEEVIEPTVNHGFNVNFFGQGYADIAKSARNTWEIEGNGPVTMDANGWPQNDATLVVQETLNQGLDVDPLMEGITTFSFKGRANVNLVGNLKAVDGSNTPALSYNAATNTTTGSLRVISNGWNASYFKLTNTDRTGQLPARKNGITELKLMRPSTPGGSTPYPAGTIFNDQARAAGSKFTALRVNLNNANSERTWSDRTTPSFFNQSIGKGTNNYYAYFGGKDPNPSPYGNGPSWEYCVMLANETGADLYVNLPAMADGWSPSDTNSYVYKLAQLIRYGSDGVNPYSAPTANPVYPPLNPNLRVYVEYSNEIWNSFGSAFRQYFDVNEMMKADARIALGIPSANDLVDTHARPTDFAILNFDNLSTAVDGNGNFASGDTWRKRKIILRALQISEIFRSVWGDANIGPRVRPLYEWQYSDDNATASAPLKFVNDYFNNGDGGNHVATPRPVNHFFWGGGGASYYSAVNAYGTTDQLANSSFETPVRPTGYSAAPSGATWTFTGTAGIARDAGAGDDIPPGWAGSPQVGYIAGTGSMSIQVTIPSTQTSNVYAFVFKSVQRVKTGTSTPDTQQLRLFVNGVSMNWKSFNQSGGYTPTAYDPANPWNSFVVFWSPNTPYYSSNSFTATPGSTVTLRIEGAGAADQAAFLEDVRLASVDRMFADGFPGGGEALGQPVGSGYQSGLNIQASWAFAYGLKYVTYEGGWSLGGDTGGTPMQNVGKFRSADAAVANAKAINMFHQSGGYLNVFGTYSLWPNWGEALAEEGLLNVSQYPLISSQDERMNNLRADPANGVFLPNNLVIGNASLLSGGNGNVAARNWISWNAITTTTSDYTITINTASGGTAQLWLGGVPLGASFTTGGTVTRTARLPKGTHGVRLQGISGNFALQSISLAIPGAPAAPATPTITDGSGTKTIEWAAVPGATGYIVRWGADSGIYLESADVPSGTSKTLTGLTHDQTYYIVVSAYNAIGLSLPSPEVGSTALVDGLSGHLARWDFAGNTGNEATLAPSSSTSRLDIVNLSRGPGLRLSGYNLFYTSDSFAYQQVSYPGSTTAAGALTRGDYTQFTVTPKSSTTVSFSSLLYAPYWQDSAPNISIPGIAYSINGGPYTIAPVTGTPGAGSGSPLTATLSGIAALQNLTVPVTFRLLHPNVGDYSFAGIGRQLGDDIVLFGSVNDPFAQVAPPVISPNGGSFSTPQSVTLATTTQGATIRYTTDGSTPTSTVGTVYTGAITLSTITTLKAIAYAAGITDSTVSTASFSIVPIAPAAPVIASITGGTSKTVQWNAVSGATGYLLRWGTQSGVYPNSADVPSGTSSIVSGLLVNQTYYFAVTAYNGAGSSLPSAEVSSIVQPEGAIVQLARWELSGATGNEVTSPPSTSSSEITVVSLSRGPGLRLSGYGASYTSNGFAYQQVSYPGSTNAATALARGDYTEFAVTPNGSGTVSLSSLLYTPYWQDATPAIANLGIAYSINGGAYTIATVSGTPATLNGSPLTATLSGIPALQNVTGTVTFRLLHPAIGEYSFAGLGRYTGDDIVLLGSVNGGTAGVAAPVISPNGGSFSGTQSVSITTTTPGSTIRYTTDGSTPTSTVGTVYTGAITVSATTTLKALAYAAGMTDSSVTTASFTLTLPAAAAPSFTPAAGTYATTQTVAISSSTSGASIRYTTDGSTPTSTVGTLYTGAITVSATTTVKALAYAASLADSSVSTAIFTITPPAASAPSFAPAAGTYATTQTVTISSSTSGASIRYTTDGSTPTSTTGTLYSAPVSVAVSQSIKAIAYAAGTTDSLVATAAYTIGSAPPYGTQLVINPGFESGTTGWLNGGGGSFVAGAKPNTAEALAAHGGANQAYWNVQAADNQNPNYYLYQDVDLSAFAGDIDAGNVKVDATVWSQGRGSNKIQILFYKADGSLAHTYDSGVKNIATPWNIYGIEGYTMWSGVRRVQFRYYAWDVWTPVNPVGAADDFSLKLTYDASRVAPHNNRICFIGDSITQGKSDGSQWTYRFPLWKRMIDAGYAGRFDFIGSVNRSDGGDVMNYPSYNGYTMDSDNEGHWGWRIDEVNAQLSGWMNAYPYPPDIVTILLGTNDNAYGDSVALMKSEMQQTINIVRSKNPKVIILVGLPYQDFSGSLYSDMRVAFRELAKSNHTVDSPCIAVDMQEGFACNPDSGGMTVDWTHPSNVGAAVLAETWWDVLSQYLQANGAPLVPSVTLSASPAGLVEDGGTATITATLSAAADSNVVVSLAASGTATGGGTDYTLAPSSITITAGQLTGTATVTAVQDALSDSNETIILDISGVTNANEAGQQQVTLTILPASTEPTAAAPSFTPAAGTYATAQAVTISSSTAGASIRYTTDGSTPTSTTGILYTTPISVAVSQTLRAIAFAAGTTDSLVTSAAYTIGSAPIVAYASQSAAYAVSSTDLINGLTPAVTGNTNWAQESHLGAPALNNGVFTGRATVGTTGGRDIIWNFATPQDLTSLQLFFSWVDPGRDNVPVVQIYTSSTPYVLTNGPSGEAPESLQGVAAGITANGGFTLLASTVDTSPTTGLNSRVTLSHTSGTLATAVRSIYFKFGAAENDYVGCNEIDVFGSATPSTAATPTFSPAAGTYTAAQSVTLSTSTAGASIRYTTDGSTPTSTTGTLYTGAIAIGTSQTLKALAYQSGLTDSTVASAAYVINLPSGLASFRTANGLAADGSQDLLTPAGDGVANLLKYAFNLLGSGAGQAPTLSTPNASSLSPTGSAGLPFISLDGTGKVQLTFIRRKAAATPAPGITYAVEFSDDLTTWGANPSATESTVSLDATFERVTFTDSVSQARRFVRVRVTTL